MSQRQSYAGIFFIFDACPNNMCCTPYSHAYNNNVKIHFGLVVLLSINCLGREIFFTLDESHFKYGAIPFLVLQYSHSIILPNRSSNLLLPSVLYLVAEAVFSLFVLAFLGCCDGAAVSPVVVATAVPRNPRRVGRRRMMHGKITLAAQGTIG